VVGQPEIIVRAHVEHALSAGDFDLRILGAGDDTLGFVKALVFDFLKRLREVLFEFCEHGCRRLLGFGGCRKALGAAAAGRFWRAKVNNPKKS
jgi:hypothetical protein